MTISDQYQLYFTIERAQKSFCHKLPQRSKMRSHGACHTYHVDTIPLRGTRTGASLNEPSGLKNIHPERFHAKEQSIENVNIPACFIHWLLCQLA